MNVNLGPSPAPCPDNIDNDGAPLGISCLRLAVNNQHSFDLVVDRYSQDEISQAILNQQYSYPAGYTLLAELLPSTGRVLDLGAHIGTFSCYAAAQGHRVLAVEASRQNMALLRTSVARNPSFLIEVHHAAISDQPGTLEFIQGGPYGLVANPSMVAPTVQVAATTVDDLLAEAGWSGVDFLKLDIEGSEVKALRGMAGLLQRTDAPVVFYESNGYTLDLFGETPHALMAAFEGFGYHCYLIDVLSNPWALRPVRASDFQPACNVDYVALKQPPTGLNGWQLCPPFTTAALVERIVAATRADHPIERAYMARVLASAGPQLLAQPRVQQALRQLQQDDDERVQTDAAWWDSNSVHPLRRWWWTVRTALAGSS